MAGTTVESVRPVTRGYNLVVQVLEAKVVMERRGGKNGVRFAECLVGDETGTIVMTCRNEEVDLAQPGAYLTLTNARVDMYRSSMRISVDKWGKMEAAESQKFKPLKNNNLSLVEFEFVPYDIMGQGQQQHQQQQPAFA